MIYSCKGSDDYQPIDAEKVPVQIVKDVSITQSEKGSATMRMKAPTMKRYSYVKDSVQVGYEYYPDGFNVFAYTEAGELETKITAKEAKHVTTVGQESWSVFGDVVIINYIKGEQMESDTIYWNQEEKKIYTNCYVKLSSEQGMMQGYGMESDEMARNAIIKRPFDSYSVMQDSTHFYMDSVNFIGPLMQRF